MIQSYTGLPTDPQQLHAALNALKNRNIIRNNVIRPNQWTIILPASGHSNSKDFDITVIIVFIRNGTNIAPPNGGWNISTPHRADNSIGAFCLLSRALRNDYSHNKIPIILTLVQFQGIYQRIENIAFGLCSRDNQNFAVYGAQLKEFKNGSLHPHMMSILQIVQKKVDKLDESTVNTVNFRMTKGYFKHLIADLELYVQNENMKHDKHFDVLEITMKEQAIANEQKFNSLLKQHDDKYASRFDEN